MNHPGYGRLYNYKYYQILGCCNNWILMIILDDETNEENYEHINRTILDGNEINMSVIITE